MSDNKYTQNCGCKEAVCVDAGRVYDSCSDKDCLEDLRVFFTERDQMVIDHAVSVRAKKAEVLSTYIDVEALPFNRGYYSCDLTFFFRVELEVYTGHGGGCCTVSGIAVFQKKVILYGSEGNVKVFAGEFSPDCHDRQEMPTRNMPRCCVQIAEPVVLAARLVEKCNCGCVCDCCASSIPGSVCEQFGGSFVDCDCEKIVLVTLGIFTIVQLIRNVQMLVPVYDFCVPAKECCPNKENHCY
ncbi:MAG: hypothetical protein J6Q42_00345, partial [Clostridia bacterium]|nr:hypothetical protein [Clostridia bacterium]